MKEIYIDCTSVILSELNTGIQRVERNIILESIEIAKKRGAHFQPVCLYSKDSYIKVDINTMQTPLNFYLYKIILNLNEFWRVRRLIKSIFYFKAFNNWIDANWTSWKKWVLLFVCLLLTSPILIACTIYSKIKLNNKKWQPQPNHLFINPGSLWWESHDALMFLNKAKKNGCTIVTILYDIIPISHPEYVDKNNHKNFISRFPLICNYSDLFIAISKSVKHDLEEYLEKASINETPNIEYFRLGCELDLIKKNIAIRKDIMDLFFDKSSAPYVCVGSVEPRKNHKFLLDAFDKLWKSGRHEKLCIIGRHGWLIDDLVARIHQHPQFEKSLFWFTDLTDDELSYCYRHANCLIFPSVVEGFGLPLVEALNYQCPVMASDIPVFHEIADDYCAFFSLNDTGQLVDLIKQFEISNKLPKVKKDIKSFDWPNWKQSTEEFWTILDRYI